MKNDEANRATSLAQNEAIRIDQLITEAFELVTKAGLGARSHGASAPTLPGRGPLANAGASRSRILDEHII